MTRNVFDNAILLNAISGVDENDLTSFNKDEDFTRLIGQDISNLKIAVPNYYMSELINKEVKANVLNIIEMLKNKGCTVDYIDVPYLEFAIPLNMVYISMVNH